MDFIRTLSQFSRGDEETIGERACDLAVLVSHGFFAPPTFAITNHAFEEFIRQNQLQGRIAQALASGDAAHAYEEIRELLLESELPPAVRDEVLEGYASLGIDADATVHDIVKADDAPFVTLIPSPNHAVPSESRDGILQNVHGAERLVLSLKECWACFFTPAWQRHRTEAGIDNSNLNTGVLVQRMGRGDLSCEAMSAIDGDVERISVRVYFGALDTGVSIEKDECIFSREYLSLVEKRIARQTTMLARDEEDRLGKVPIGLRGEEQKLTDPAAAELARLAKRASQVLERPVRIYFNIRGEETRVLFADRLLLTKGMTALDGYRAEERIGEREGTEEPGTAAPDASKRSDGGS